MPGAERPLRLSLFIRRFHPIVGGMERQAMALLRRLPQRGIRPTVLTARWRRDLPSLEAVEGLTIRRVGPAGAGRAGAYGSLPALLLAPEARPGGFDVAAVFGTGDLALVGARAARRAGRPWLMRPATAGDVSRYLDPAQAPGADALRRWLRAHVPPSTWRARRLREAAAAVAISGEIEAELLDWGFHPRRVLRLPNGVDTDRFRPADGPRRAAVRARLGLPTEARVAVFLGRLVRRKGLLDLGKAWLRLAADDRLPPGALLVLAGSGEGQADRLDAEFREHVAHQADIRLVGQVDAPEDWLAAADVLVLPSTAEGLPNAALEAMASGLPCLLSDLPAHRELITDGAEGLLHPVGDVAALAEGLRRLLAEPSAARVMGAAARSRAVACFGMEANADRWAQLLHRLAAGAAAGTDAGGGP